MSFIHLNTLVMQPPPHVEDDNNSTMMTASGSSSDDWLLEGLDAKRPPSWARIGLFGSHRSGKELFVASVAGMSSSSSKVSPLPQTSAHFANGGQHVLPPPPLVAPSVAASLGRGSPSSFTMVQSEEDETLLSFICDASVTLMECGAHCAGGSYPHPTRAQLRIAIPRPVGATSSHNSHHHAGGRTSGSKPIRIGSASTGGEASAATSAAASHFVDIEVINFWTFLAEGEAPRDAKTAAAPPPPPTTTLPLSSSVVVLPDVALTTCDAFIVVLDLSRYDTFAYCHQVLSKLHDIFNRDVSGADGSESSATAAAASVTQTAQSSSSTPNSRLVAAVIASTHRLVQPGGVNDGSEGDSTRCVSSEECRALGTQWGVPVFEVSLSPSDMLRHRKVLEKIISRVMHVRGAL